MATCAISATEANVMSTTGAKGRDDSQINLVKRAQAGDELCDAVLEYLVGGQACGTAPAAPLLVLPVRRRCRLDAQPAQQERLEDCCRELRFAPSQAALAHQFLRRLA